MASTTDTDTDSYLSYPTEHGTEVMASNTDTDTDSYLSYPTEHGTEVMASNTDTDTDSYLSYPTEHGTESSYKETSTSHDTSAEIQEDNQRSETKIIAVVRKSHSKKTRSVTKPSVTESVDESILKNPREPITFYPGDIDNDLSSGYRNIIVQIKQLDLKRATVYVSSCLLVTLNIDLKNIKIPREHLFDVCIFSTEYPPIIISIASTNKLNNKMYVAPIVRYINGQLRTLLKEDITCVVCDLAQEDTISRELIAQKVEETKTFSISTSMRMTLDKYRAVLENFFKMICECKTFNFFSFGQETTNPQYLSKEGFEIVINAIERENIAVTFETDCDTILLKTEIAARLSRKDKTLLELPQHQYRDLDAVRLRQEYSSLAITHSHGRSLICRYKVTGSGGITRQEHVSECVTDEEAFSELVTTDFEDSISHSNGTEKDQAKYRHVQHEHEYQLVHAKCVHIQQDSTTYSMQTAKSESMPNFHDSTGNYRTSRKDSIRVTTTDSGQLNTLKAWSGGERLKTEDAYQKAHVLNTKLDGGRPQSETSRLPKHIWMLKHDSGKEDLQMQNRDHATKKPYPLTLSRHTKRRSKTDEFLYDTTECKSSEDNQSLFPQTEIIPTDTSSGYWSTISESTLQMQNRDHATKKPYPLTLSRHTKRRNKTDEFLYDTTECKSSEDNQSLFPQTEIIPTDTSSDYWSTISESTDAKIVQDPTNIPRSRVMYISKSDSRRPHSFHFEDIEAEDAALRNTHGHWLSSSDLRAARNRHIQEKTQHITAPSMSCDRQNIHDRVMTVGSIPRRSKSYHDLAPSGGSIQRAYPTINTDISHSRASKHTLHRRYESPPNTASISSSDGKLNDPLKPASHDEGRTTRPHSFHELLNTHSAVQYTINPTRHLQRRNRIATDSRLSDSKNSSSDKTILRSKGINATSKQIASQVGSLKGIVVKSSTRSVQANSKASQKTASQLRRIFSEKSMSTLAPDPPPRSSSFEIVKSTNRHK